MYVSAIIAAAGLGRRLGAGVPKQLLELDGRSILERSVSAFRSHPGVAEVVVALPPDLAAAPPEWLGGVTVVAGGERRQDSVANAFDAISSRSDVVLVHDAARPFVSAEVIGRTIDAAAAHGAAIAAVPVTDTVKRVAHDATGHVIVETIPRADIYLAQTPQGFQRDVLAAAVALGRKGKDATDEASLAEQAGHRVHVVEGDPLNVKITTAGDLDEARRRTAGMADRVGTGYDLHRLVEGRLLILGGVTIPSDRGALGHSDADVVCHSVTDAILGAACLGDIGRHFPDSEGQWKDASSLDLLRRAVELTRAEGYRVINLDIVVVLERPKIGPYVQAIREGVGAAVGIDARRVSVKGKTNEGVDAVGRGEAIAAHAVALLSCSTF